MKVKTTDEKKAFAERLKTALKQSDHADKRQLELAKEIGVAPATVSNWPINEIFPDMERLIKLAKLSHVRFDWLATGRQPMRIISNWEKPFLVVFQHLTDDQKYMIINCAK